MEAMEFEELVEDVVAWLAAGVGEEGAAGHEGVGDAAEALGDFDVDPAWVFTALAPVGGPDLEVMVVGDQVVGALQEGNAKRGMPGVKKAPLAIQKVILMGCGHESGAAGNVVGGGEEVEGPEF